MNALDPKKSIVASLPSGRRLKMADPRLPLTVSRAAIELDNASRGENVTFEATKQFLEVLQESLKQGVDVPGTHTAWLDANTVDVVGDALVECEGPNNVRTVKDVFDRAWTFVHEMEQVEKTEEDTKYDRLRRFCVAFGNSLLSFRAKLKEGPTNPRRR